MSFSSAAKSLLKALSQLEGSVDSDLVTTLPDDVVADALIRLRHLQEMRQSARDMALGALMEASRDGGITLPVPPPPRDAASSANPSPRASVRMRRPSPRASSAAPPGSPDTSGRPNDSRSSAAAGLADAGPTGLLSVGGPGAHAAARVSQLMQRESSFNFAGALGRQYSVAADDGFVPDDAADADDSDEEERLDPDDPDAALLGGSTTRPTSWWARCSGCYRNQKTVRYLAVVSIFVQCFNVTLLYALHKAIHDDNAGVITVRVALGIPCAVQVLYLIHELYVQVRIVRSMADGDVGLELLVQAFLSVLWGFAGTHQLLHAINPASYAGNIPSVSLRDMSFGECWTIFISFLYFSATTTTTTGFGDIVPTMFYSRLVTVVQQLSGLVFTSAVLSVGVSKFATNQATGAAKMAKKRSKVYAAYLRAVYGDTVPPVASGNASARDVPEAGDAPACAQAPASPLTAAAVARQGTDDSFNHQQVQEAVAPRVHSLSAPS